MLFLHPHAVQNLMPVSHGSPSKLLTTGLTQAGWALVGQPWVLA